LGSSFSTLSTFIDKYKSRPKIPSWIYTQKSLQDLWLSSSGISLVDRNKFSSLIEGITSAVYLSNNSIAEDISNITLNCSFLRLDRNNFTGGLPNISPIAGYVDLSYTPSQDQFHIVG
jgi:hypothetical protein